MNNIVEAKNNIIEFKSIPSALYAYVKHSDVFKDFDAVAKSRLFEALLGNCPSYEESENLTSETEATITEILADKGKTLSIQTLPELMAKAKEFLMKNLSDENRVKRIPASKQGTLEAKIFRAVEEFRRGKLQFNLGRLRAKTASTDKNGVPVQKSEQGDKGATNVLDLIKQEEVAKLYTILLKYIISRTGNDKVAHEYLQYKKWPLIWEYIQRNDFTSGNDFFTSILQIIDRPSDHIYKKKPKSSNEHCKLLAILQEYSKSEYENLQKQMMERADPYLRLIPREPLISIADRFYIQRSPRYTSTEVIDWLSGYDIKNHNSRNSRKAFYERLNFIRDEMVKALFSPEQIVIKNQGRPKIDPSIDNSAIKEERRRAHVAYLRNYQKRVYSGPSIKDNSSSSSSSSGAKKPTISSREIGRKSPCKQSVNCKKAPKHFNVNLCITKGFKVLNESLNEKIFPEENVDFKNIDRNNISKPFKKKIPSMDHNKTQVISLLVSGIADNLHPYEELQPYFHSLKDILSKIKKRNKINT